MSIKVTGGNIIGLREISDEEKLAWWRENIGGPESYQHVSADGQGNLLEKRSWTDEEWSATFRQPHKIAI